MIRLRAFTPSDLAPAFQLDQLCFPPGIAYSLAEMQYFTTQRSEFSLVAELEEEPAGTLAGFLVASHNPRRKDGPAHIVTIDVAPAARRRGIATFLMNAAEEHYRALQCSTLHLEVAVDNHSAQEFYGRLGFTIIGRRRGYYNGTLDAFSMSKPLII